jgi:hypothetical protein
VEKLRKFAAILGDTGDNISTFDPALWRRTIESVTIRSLEDITYTFKSGTQIQTRAQ